jgi:type I restriction enzyme, S subunit
MIDSLHAYPEYKDSGLPWLGRIPKHWDCLPHREIFEEIKEQGHVDEQLLSVTIGKGIIRQEDLLADSSKKDSSNLDKSKYKLVAPGDIAYNKMRAWQGAVGVSRYRGIVSPAYIVQRLRGESRPEYFHYLFRTPGFAKEAERWSYGITSDQWSLRSQHFKMIYSCAPPLDEQGLIVGFLRDFDRQVRRFIRNRRRLIEVLNEQKQAIINRAVTRGLDPTVSLKPSGIEWLGNIPAHWKPVRLGLFIDLLTGFPFKSSGFTENASDIRLLRGINVAPGRVRWDSVVRWPSAASGELSAFALKEGDVVFGMDRPVISGGIRVAAIKAEDVPSLLLQRVARIRARDELNQQYLLLLLQDRRYADYLAPIFTGISVPHISPAQISDYRVSLPPLEEQRAILDHVEAETQAAEGMKERAEQEIRLIREYRTRLIADVVTGKVDVRHLAPPPGSEDLEEMVEEFEPLDDAAGELEDEGLAGEVARADD